MLKKKILGIIIVLGSCTACITQGAWYNIAVGETKNLGQNIESTPDNAGNFGGYDTVNELSKNVFYLADRSTNDFMNTKMAFYYWIDEGLAYYRPGSYKIGGLVTKFYITDYNGYVNITQPNAQSLSTGTYGDIANLGITYGDITDIAYNDQWLKYQRGFPLCFRGQNKDFSICTFCNEGTNACGLEQTGNYINPTQTQIALFSNIPDEYLKDSIWYQTSNKEQTVGCMNIKTQIMMYGASYNTGLCYTNDKQWSGSLYTGERVTVTPKSIFEIFTGFDSYKTRRNIYENSCHAPYTQEYCISRMQGNQEATEFFTKIDNAINNQGLTTVTAEKVYQYCHLQLNFTEDEKRETNICEAKEEGTYYATGVTENSIQNPIEGLTNIVLQEGSEIMLPNDGTVFDQILPEGIITRKDFALDVDNLKEALNIGRKFINLFVIREQKEGILPTYISSLILIFVFYQIIRRRTGN